MTDESDVHVILAHLEHVKNDIQVLCKETRDMRQEINQLKLQIKDTYIPRAACLEVQKRCNSKMDSAVTKDEFAPVKKVVFFLVFVMIAAVAKAALQGVVIK